MFSPDDRDLWAVSAQGHLLRFNTADGALLQQLQQPHKGGCTALCIDPAMRCIVTGGADFVLRVWEYLPQDKLRAEANAVPAYQSFTGHPGVIKGDQQLAELVTLQG